MCNLNSSQKSNEGHAGSGYIWTKYKTQPKYNARKHCTVLTQINAQQVCCFCLQIKNQLSRLTSSQFELQSRVGEGHVRDVDVFDVTPDNRIVSFKSWSATSPACSLPPTPPPQCPQAGLPELWWWSCIADDYAGDDLLSHFLDLLWWEPSTLSSCCPEKLRVTDLVFFLYSNLKIIWKN